MHLAFCVVLAAGVATAIFVPQLIYFFRNEEEVVEAGTLTLCLTSFTIALSGASMTANYMLQISGYMWIATFIGTCRFGLVLGLVAVILSSVFDLLGVQTAQPVSDIIATLATLLLVVKCLYGFDAEEKKDQAKRRKGAGGTARRRCSGSSDLLCDHSKTSWPEVQYGGVTAGFKYPVYVDGYNAVCLI